MSVSWIDFNSCTDAETQCIVFRLMSRFCYMWQVCVCSNEGQRLLGEWISPCIKINLNHTPSICSSIGLQTVAPSLRGHFLLKGGMTERSWRTTGLDQMENTSNIDYFRLLPEGDIYWTHLLTMLLPSFYNQSLTFILTFNLIPKTCNAWWH